MISIIRKETGTSEPAGSLKDALRRANLVRQALHSVVPGREVEAEAEGRTDASD
jgi:hypothetical protein